jgi:hypothetical protein
MPVLYYRIDLREIPKKYWDSPVLKVERGSELMLRKKYSVSLIISKLNSVLIFYSSQQKKATKGQTHTAWNA